MLTGIQQCNPSYPVVNNECPINRALPYTKAITFQPQHAWLCADCINQHYEQDECIFFRIKLTRLPSCVHFFSSLQCSVTLHFKMSCLLVICMLAATTSYNHEVSWWILCVVSTHEISCDASFYTVLFAFNCLASACHFWKPTPLRNC